LRISRDSGVMEGTTREISNGKTNGHKTYKNGIIGNGNTKNVSLLLLLLIKIQKKLFCYHLSATGKIHRGSVVMA